MNPLILAPVLEIGKTLIERWFPDPEKARQAEAEFLRFAMEGELRQVIAQLEINAREATHPSIWVAGWRPFFGWGSGAGFLYATIVQPFLAWVALIKGYPEPPMPNVDLLWVVAAGMLGIGGLRTFEKTRGVSR